MLTKNLLVCGYQSGLAAYSVVRMPLSNLLIANKLYQKILISKIKQVLRENSQCAVNLVSFCNKISHRKIGNKQPLMKGKHSQG